MKVWIETSQCTGSGLCELLEERVFILGGDSLAHVREGGRVLPSGPGNHAEVPDSYADSVYEASRACPGGCIRYSHE